jgi:hypothetical protein
MSSIESNLRKKASRVVTGFHRLGLFLFAATVRADVAHGDGPECLAVALGHAQSRLTSHLRGSYVRGFDTAAEALQG